MFRIGVSVDLVGAHGRAVYRGVGHYVSTRRDLVLHRPQLWQFRERDPLEWLSWGVDAVVYQVNDIRQVQALRQWGRPVVNVSSLVTADLPRVGVDHDRIARMAAEHLLACGFRRFAFLSMGMPEGYAAPRCRSFAAAISDARRTCYVERKFAGRVPDGEASIDDEVQWLTRVQKPVGIFTASDAAAVLLLDACRQAGIAVPEDAAVLGVDDEELVQQAVRPPLSSIAVPSVQIGFEAARRIDQMLHGKPVDPGPLLLPPERVVVRQSTEVMALEDRDVAECLRFLRENALQPISIEQTLARVPVARRSLERRFRQAVGRTPLQELHRLRVEKARQLLSDTDMPIGEVVGASGFGNASRFAQIFRQWSGMTPIQYRRQFRIR